MQSGNLVSRFERRLTNLYLWSFVGFEVLGIAVAILWGNAIEATEREEIASTLTLPLLVGASLAGFLLGLFPHVSFRLFCRLLFLRQGLEAGPEAIAHKFSLLPTFFLALAFVLNVLAFLWLVKGFFARETFPLFFQGVWILHVTFLAQWPRNTEAGSLERLLGTNAHHIERELERRK